MDGTLRPGPLQPPHPRPAACLYWRMDVHTSELSLSTRGHGDIQDLSAETARWLRDVEADRGQLTLFVPGSTAGLTTIEFESGALRDLEEALERAAPSDVEYHHDRRWGDGNGFSHVRAALIGPSITIPVSGGVMTLGTWQQPVLVECDVRPRTRRLVLSFVGTCNRGGAPCHI